MSCMLTAAEVSHSTANHFCSRAREAPSLLLIERHLLKGIYKKYKLFGRQTEGQLLNEGNEQCARFASSSVTRVKTFQTTATVKVKHVLAPEKGRSLCMVALELKKIILLPVIR